jgi:hypothetical protein
VPSGGRHCPCCGKTFLTARGNWKREEGNKVELLGREDLALEVSGAEGASTEVAADEALDWRTLSGGIAILVFMALVGRFTFQSIGNQGQARSQWVDAEGRGRVVPLQQDTPSGSAVEIYTTDLRRYPRKVELVGKLTNRQERIIARAEVVTTFTGPDGKTLGVATGTVANVQPGEAAVFKTAGKLRIRGSQAQGLRWKTAVGKVELGGYGKSGDR